MLAELNEGLQVRRVNICISHLSAVLTSPGLSSCDMDCVTTSNKNERNPKTKTHDIAKVLAKLKSFIKSKCSSKSRKTKQKQVMYKNQMFYLLLF